MPITESSPTKTFQAAIYRALGLYFEMTIPDRSTPIAENASATVPVTKLDVEADCLYWVSIYFGVKIQYGMNPKK